MTNYSIEHRKQQFFRLSSQIAQIDQMQLQALLGESEPESGWGTTQSIAIGQAQVFVKRIPVTQIEYDNLFSTRNLYGLPTYYNYGVGSAGFGVFRELIAHIKTTNWVLEELIETFPLMYHYRIVPFVGHRAEVDREQQKRYVEYWGSCANIGRYTADRAIANYELVLFLEYIPFVLSTWLPENLSKLPIVLEEMRRTIAFLNQNGIIHFDAHFQNILTDGEQIYFTDFGLVLDQSFTLTQEEQRFFEQNKLYDYGTVLASLGYVVRSLYDSCSESDQRSIQENYGITANISRAELVSILLNNIEPLHTDQIIDLDPYYVDCIVQYRRIIVLMQNFFSNLRSNSKKNTKLPHAELQQLLLDLIS